MNAADQHVAEPDLARYARGLGDDAFATGVEGHLIICAACRGAIAGHADPERMRANWEVVSAGLLAPRPGVAERLLDRVSGRGDVVRLLSATPALQLSWSVAVVVVLACAAVFARYGLRTPLLFLAVAPLPPLLGVATAFGAGVDPTHEVGLAAPLHGFRLLLLRTAAVTGTSVVLGVPAGLAAGLGWLAAAWLLPALGLVVLAMVLSSTTSATRAAAGVAVGWLALVTAVAVVAADDLLLFRAAGQLAAAAVAAAGAVVLARRQEAFDRRSAR